MRKFAKQWTEEEKEIVFDMLEDSLYSDISCALTEAGHQRSPEAVRKMVKRVSKVKHKDPVAVKPPIRALPDKRSMEYEGMNMLECDALSEMEQKRNELFNMNFDRYENIGKPKGKLHKILSIGDLHIPWVNDNVLRDALSKHSDADVLVVNGDILDQFSVSRWPKSKHILLRHEYEIGMRYLKHFASQFKKVVLVRGNHDVRVQSYFSAQLDPAITFLTHPDLLERMAKGYDFNAYGELEKMYDFNNVYYKGGLCAWYAKIGNAIFAHPSGGSGIPMRTCVNAANYFLEKEPYDAMVIGHTHKLGQLIWKGKLLIEQGCCCVPMDYEADAKLKYGQQSFGYSVIYMNDKGEVDFDRSRPVYCGSATLVDADIQMNIGD